ncbi:MAG: hypothetical protein NC930_01280 [Candidatus Omnitrophica bacterium]|nr:hypothetical protein [Candidatus Omnitrophota bacterium]
MVLVSIFAHGVYGEAQEPSAPGKPPPLEGFEKKIFLDLRDINVVDVLKFLALEGNLNIVTSKNVQGRSTLLLRNVKIQDAMDIILISNQLAYENKDGIIYVMTEDEYRQLYGKSFNDKRKILTRTLKYAKPSYVLSTLQSILSEIGKIIIDEETGTIVMIDSKEKLAQMDALLKEIEKKRETQVVKLQYADAREVEAKLQTELQAKSVGAILGDQRSNQVVVSAYPDRLKEILPIIKSLDSKAKAVLVDVRILQLTINPEFDYGIDWEKTFQKLSTKKYKHLKSLDIRGAYPISSTVSSSTSLGSVQKLALGTTSLDEFAVDLRFVKQIQKTNVLANPRLTILNREEAKINIGDRIPYVVTTTTGTGTNVSISEEIKFIDVGIILTVTPIINDDGFIIMKIRPEISSQTGTLTTPAGAEIPLVNTTYVESSVVIKDGMTVVLGGLRRDDYSEDTSGTPPLMNIPVLGHLFKSRNEAAQKTEILILITPKIITGEKNVTCDPLELKPSRLMATSVA